MFGNYINVTQTQLDAEKGTDTFVHLCVRKPGKSPQTLTSSSRRHLFIYANQHEQHPLETFEINRCRNVPRMAVKMAPDKVARFIQLKRS